MKGSHSPVMQAFAVKRIAVTAPPASWGKDRDAAQLCWGVLEDLGMELFHVDVGLLWNGAAADILAHVRDIRAFHPDMAIATPNAGYAMLAWVEDGGARRNLFLDLLEVPTLVTWDSVAQFAHQLSKDRLARHPDQSCPGILAQLRAILNHPLMVHAAYDRSQIAVMERLGVVDVGRVIHTPVFAYQAFVDYGRNAAADRPAAADAVAFTGTMRRPRPDDPLLAVPACADLFRQVIEERPLDQPVWAAFEAALARMPAAERAAARLEPDHSFFWSVATDLIATQATLGDRGRMLSGLRHDAAFYGWIEGVRPGQPTPWPHVHLRGDVDMATALPALNAATPITIDVVNRIFDSGVTAKIVSCYAAGGFCLFDHRPEFLDMVGADGERVMFRTVEQLNAMIDHYLTHPAERRELARQFQTVIAERQSARTVYARMIAAAEDRISRQT